MIKQITLENYRCYKKHIVEFNDLSIVVGKNNAGKSTLIEALRLISLITSRYKTLPYKQRPSWSNLPLYSYGISPSTKGIDISFKNIFYRNGKSPAKIKVIFLDKSKIELIINEDGNLFAIIYNSEGEIIKTKSQANNTNLPTINILPQIGPLRESESFLDQDYVKANIHSKTSSLHFRNQLLNFGDFYNNFVKLAQKTWDGLKIKEFKKGDRLYDILPELIIEDDGFLSEVGSVGHGLQMWLQTMWFLSRCDSSSTIILDEPDVYLHADMQRKLISFLKNKFRQIIIATHSIEIISEVNPQDIIIINKSKANSKNITNLQTVQKIIENIGSLQNIELIRYWSSKKLLAMEGKYDDIKILNIFQSKIFPNSKNPIITIPKYYSGGWGGWQKVIGASSIKGESKSIKIYCLFDSDYHLESEKKQRLEEAKKHDINLHIWNKKEIENYLINSDVIFKYIYKHHSKGNPTLEKIKQKIELFINAEKDNIMDSYSTEIKSKNPELALSSCNKKARDFINKNWGDINNKIKIAPGKKIINDIIKWSGKEFGITYNKFNLADSFEDKEIDSEIKNIITNIENNKSFTK